MKNIPIVRKDTDKGAVYGYYKNSIRWFSVIMALVLLSGVGFAFVVKNNILTYNVDTECISTTLTDIVVTGLSPGETQTDTVTISNTCLTDITVTQAITETRNPSGVLYTLTYDSANFIVAASGSVNKDIVVTINNGSPLGVLTLSADANRPVV